MVHAAVGMCGDAEDVDPSGADLHHEQDIESAQADCVEVEEVDREETGCLGAQERSPRESVSPRCRVESPVGEDPADGARADAVAESDQFALDAVSPAGVLPGQSDDQLTGFLADRWSTASLWIGPFAASRRWCQASRVAGVTIRCSRSWRGSTWARAESTARSD